MLNNRFRDFPFDIVWPVVISIVLFLLAFGAVAWRVNQGPDVFTDEIMYTRLSARIDGEGAMVWDDGDPFMVHPPLYFLFLAQFQSATNAPPAPLFNAGDVFALVYHSRYLNAIFAGLTAVVLYLLGRSLQGDLLGLLMAALFILDPFGLRINRRAMLETLAGLLSLGGMAVLLTAPEGRIITLPRAIVAGLLLGFGVLAKELAFLTVLAVLIFAVWELFQFGVPAWQRLIGRSRVHSASPFFTAVGVAMVTYSIYPAWALANGHWRAFFEEKILGVLRLVGLVQLTGWNRPGVSLADLLIERLSDYGSTYLLLFLGGAAAVWLYLNMRQERSSRMLVIWGLVLYPIFAFIALFGSGNDQFFYFLLLTAIVLFSYVAVLIIQRITESIRPESVFYRQETTIMTIMVFGLLVVILPFNLIHWWQNYGIGHDNAYYQLRSFVRESLPEGEAINASGDAIKFRYFFPEREITFAATPEEAQTFGVHYFVLAPKDVRARYGRIQPELADWIRAQGTQLFAISGDSYGDVFLYHVPHSGELAQTDILPPTFGSAGQVFEPAEGAYLRGLPWVLAFWLAAMGAGAYGLKRYGHLLRDNRRGRGYDPSWTVYAKPEETPRV